MREKGITLIALVITIIILLILASVTIATLTGDNGIITKATEAREQTIIAQYKEAMSLIRAKLEIEKTYRKFTAEQYMEEYKERIKQDTVFEGYQKLVRNNLLIDLTTKEGYIFKLSQEKEPLYVGKQGEALKEMTTNIEVQNIENKKVRLVGKTENVLGREYTYRIIANNKECQTGTTTSDKITYDYTTTFGTTEVRMEIEYDGKSIQSNTATIEDNKINSRAELEKLRDEVNAGNSYEGKTIEQLNNIDLQGSTSNKWTPIGTTVGNSFKGTYDGGGYAIENIYIDANQEESQGMFGFNLGTIKNLGIESGTIKNVGSRSGAIAGETQKRIEHCYNKVDIAGEGGFIGGISGITYNGGLISQCYNDGNLTVQLMEDTDTVGGISGCITGEGTRIEQCYNTGDIEATCMVISNVRICGIAGMGDPWGCGIDSCYNTGTVKLTVPDGGYPVAAGIAGQMHPSGKYITNCYNIGKCSVIRNGSETTTGRVGSILGYADVERCFKLLLVNWHS